MLHTSPQRKTKLAVLRSWDRDISYEDQEIQVAEDYDFGQSPYSEFNEPRIDVSIGSNQVITAYENPTKSKEIG